MLGHGGGLHYRVVWLRGVDQYSVSWEEGGVVSFGYHEHRQIPELFTVDVRHLRGERTKKFVE